MILDCLDPDFILKSTVLTLRHPHNNLKFKIMKYEFKYVYRALGVALVAFLLVNLGLFLITLISIGEWGNISYRKGNFTINGISTGMEIWSRSGITFLLIAFFGTILSTYKNNRETSSE